MLPGGVRIADDGLPWFDGSRDEWWPMTAEGDGGGRLDFGLLGTLEVLRSGTRVPLGGRQQRAILALLLCEAGTVVSIGRLADALWGEYPPAGFLTTVQTYIFHLRELLEPHRARGETARVVVTEPGGGYRLAVADGSVDAVLFEGLVARGVATMEEQDAGQAVGLFDRALALWRGDVLADLAEFGFVAPVAGRLQELRMSALESRVEAELLLGHHGTAVAELDRLVADHPLRERLHAELILALYRSGRQSDALGAYRDLRALLHEDLGIEPSPPLQVLHRAVLAQDPALAWLPIPAIPATPVAEVGDGRATAGTQAGSRQQAPAALVGQVDEPRRGFGRRMVGTWATVVLVALGGLTTAIVAPSRSTGPGTLAANSIGAVEMDGSITAAVPVGTNPVGLAYGGGALWVANRSDGTVLRIDPRTHAVVQKIDVGLTPESLAVTAYDVWVANFADGTVTRINIHATKVVDTITVGTRPAAIAYGPGGLWVANSGDNTIQRIDPITGSVGKAIEVGDGPDGIAVGADSVWVANARDGTVSRIDPKTGADMSSPIRVGSGPKAIALVGDNVWVANQYSQSVTRISRSTGRTHSIEVGDGPSALAVAQGSVWVSEQFVGTLTRIDPVTEALYPSYIGSSPRGLATVDGRVWVAAGAFTSPAHQGGTLTVASDHLPGHLSGIDPAEVYLTPILNAERLVYDGLVGSRLASADSQALVPDLAVSLPQPSNGGKTYTFTLHPGIRYSTGRAIHASDFVLGVQKALTLEGGRPDFFAGIVGGQHCIEHHDTCNLSDGVLTDDAARRVTFRLTEPDPEFLYKLTFFVYPTPPGTSPKAVTTPLPSTGPYMIAAYAEDKTFTLKRNPYFKRWSFAAQPDGYPDVIRWLKVPDDRAAAALVISGRADMVRLTGLNDHRTTRALVEELKVRYPAQMHSDLFAGTMFEVLNAAVPPFNNLKARKAVNFAVDRSKLVELYGGPSVAVETCQMLPPKFPSYSWYCPYTSGPQDGQYHGPDLAKARELVRASGTQGMPVTVHDIVGGLGPPFNAYFAQLLRQLGYKVTLHQMPDAPPSYDFIWNRRNHVQVQSFLWGADFALASNFYDGLAACDSENNLGEYCNPELEQRAKEATGLEATDPGDALRAWTQIDRAITDEAAIVPAVNQIDWWFVSTRVRNYQSSEILGPLLSQIWVR